MNNILITSAGQRVSLVRAFQKEIKKIDENGKVFTVDLNPVLAPACHISDGYKQINRVTDPDYISNLLDICKNWNIKIIIPTIDTELLVLTKNKEIFLENGIIPIISSENFIQKCRDKRIINEFFKEKNIDIPKDIDKQNITFPLFIKPYDGSLSKDTFLIREASELKDYHFQNPKLMFMEYIDHDVYEEYTVDTYYDRNGELKCVVPRKRIFVRAGEVNKGVTQKNEIENYVKNNLSFIEGAVGCLTMQFFFHPIDKRIIGIEINPRFGGGYPLSYLAGANYPGWILKEYILNDTISYFDGWENNLLMLRYDDEILVRDYEG
ncbi:ATP-grasp domain-containing protein [Chryseobacterium sp. JUb7]|uniref:ATP-grasp domain-containing protein n=1 Tax=Chryseobacterium sp. JUb7 TaxID=2940599 RepID=UPI002167B078|nr:ATP-grasp domain-containing protein [Chryseobacterium sp. JUb7]MCS3531774.1 carbamoyl-phosphate synthase large subunit [Chryseobacterium sp. JUb7]